ncbi:MAG: twin-arginine translocase subunit TatC [Chloroflexi bacterium]|nr:twin-arginine translocase subunit TatC [Chloroflexota bacterium]
MNEDDIAENDEEKATAGNGEEEITAGNGEEKATAGTGEEKATAGTGEEEVAAGNDEEKTTTGNDEGETTAGNELTMDIWGHIEELRVRLLKSLLALLVTTLISFAFAQQIIEILAVPIGGVENLVSIEMTENVSVFMRVSLLSGVILAFPFIVYQILAFIMPGLKPGERKWIYLSIPIATILFLLGVAFANYVMLPAAIPVLVNFLGTPTTPRLSNYLNFVTNLLFWIGICFEAPLVVFILAKLKLVTPQQLLKQWRIAIVVIAILAAVISPTVDPINMGIIMVPLFFLYLLSILFAYFAK